MDPISIFSPPPYSRHRVALAWRTSALRRENGSEARARFRVGGNLIDSASLIHIGTALRDTLTLARRPPAEAHLSDIRTHEPLRRQSPTKPACQKHIGAFRRQSSLTGPTALAEHPEENTQKPI